MLKVAPLRPTRGGPPAAGGDLYWTRTGRADKRGTVQEMVIYGVSFDMVGKQPIVLLKTMNGNKFLPIWIGHAEAAAILMKLQGAETPRPMTHDLLNDLVGELDAQITKITVTELKENTFYALITLQASQSEIEIDSRPSDALALAVRSNCLLYTSDAADDEYSV